MGAGNSDGLTGVNNNNTRVTFKLTLINEADRRSWIRTQRRPRDLINHENMTKNRFRGQRVSHLYGLENPAGLPLVWEQPIEHVTSARILAAILAKPNAVWRNVLL